MAAFPEKPGQAGTKQVKQFWILIKQQIMGSADITTIDNAATATINTCSFCLTSLICRSYSRSSQDFWKWYFFAIQTNVESKVT